jgi:hypothetical protein
LSQSSSSPSAALPSLDSLPLPTAVLTGVDEQPTSFALNGISGVSSGYKAQTGAVGGYSFTMAPGQYLSAKASLGWSSASQLAYQPLVSGPSNAFLVCGFLFGAGSYPTYKMEASVAEASTTTLGIRVIAREVPFLSADNPGGTPYAANGGLWYAVSGPTATTSLPADSLGSLSVDPGSKWQFGLLLTSANSSAYVRSITLTFSVAY